VADSAVGIRAGLLRAHHYHLKNRAVSLTDCVAVEVARAMTRLWPAPTRTWPHLVALRSTRAKHPCRESGVGVCSARGWSPARV
jgi:hypothetical protein